MIFRFQTSRKIISSLIGPSVSVGGLYFVISSSSNVSTKDPTTKTMNVGSTKVPNLTGFLHMSYTRLSPYRIPSTSCEIQSAYDETEDKGLNKNKNGSSPVVSIRKRMTSIGHFTLKSETPQNLSIPTFFIALAGQRRSSDERFGDLFLNTRINSSSESVTLSRVSSKERDDKYSDARDEDRRGDFTVSELESIWTLRNMPNLHPRFHSKVCPKEDGYFIKHSTQTDEKSQIFSPTESRVLQEYAKETIHPLSYRLDLQKRIEYLLTHPLDVSHHLWEVYISNGPLGSSGAISKQKVKEFELNESTAPGHGKLQNPPGGGQTRADMYKPRESLLLFRAHHSIADGVSLVAALGDLVDEAQEIRLYLENEIRTRSEKAKNQRLFQKLGRFLINCFRFILGAISALTRQLYLMVVTWNRNPFLRALNVSTWDEAQTTLILDEQGNSPPSSRSVSWCEIAPVEEVKSLAKSVGSSVTINDVFVSCVTRAIAHQLAEHRLRSLTRNTQENLEDISIASCKVEENINIVVPVHLFGGIHIPGTGMGNRIGAFVARVRCENREISEKAPSHSSAIQHLKSVHSSLQAVKNTPAPLLSFLMAKVATTCLPSPWVSYLFRQMNANAAAVITNTRGFPKKVHINGRSVEAAAGFFPLPPGIPMGVVIQSYDGVVSISVTAERWAVPNADRMLGWILEEYNRLLNETKDIKAS